MTPLRNLLSITAPNRAPCNMAESRSWCDTIACPADKYAPVVSASTIPLIFFYDPALKFEEQDRHKT